MHKEGAQLAAAAAGSARTMRRLLSDVRGAQPWRETGGLLCDLGTTL